MQSGVPSTLQPVTIEQPHKSRARYSHRSRSLSTVLEENMLFVALFFSNMGIKERENQSQ